jgi:hypothetical protein
MLESLAGFGDGAIFFLRNGFVVNGGVGQGAENGVHHHFERTPHGVQLLGRQHIQQRVGLLASLIEIRFYGFLLAAKTWPSPR